MSIQNVLSVRQLNLYVRSLIEGDIRLNNILLSGEISNFRHHYASGHYYFTLKDNEASIRCVMFHSSAVRLNFDVKDGLKVIVRGRVSLYERDGQYQFYAEEMNIDGLGNIMLKFEEIKNRLKTEGLFDSSNKRPLPEFPNCIAVVTSPTGAAVKDIINVLSRRYPAANIVLCPVSVQGDSAAPEMIDTLETIYSKGFADLIIIGRGGGSIEDLWAFNNEELARKIYESPVPVISAVGHETDFTICDFVADMRAPTPSAAAELAVPDAKETLNKINSYRQRLIMALNNLLKLYTTRYEKCASSAFLKRPTDMIINHNIQHLDSLFDKFTNNFKINLTENENRFSTALSALDSLSPLKVLLRGYAVALKNDKSINSVEMLKKNDNFTLVLSDGSVECEVK